MPPGKYQTITEPAVCRLCESGEKSEWIGLGEDFEYRTSNDEFSAFLCRKCRLVYLNPRPVFEEFERIYPANYHAFEFSDLIRSAA